MGTDDLDQTEARLQVLRTKQAEAQRRYAQAEAKLDQVRSQRQELLDGLQAQGFDGPDAVRVRLAELSTETEQALARIEAVVKDL